MKLVSAESSEKKRKGSTLPNDIILVYTIIHRTGKDNCAVETRQRGPIVSVVFKVIQCSKTTSPLSLMWLNHVQKVFHLSFVQRST